MRIATCFCNRILHLYSLTVCVSGMPATPQVPLLHPTGAPGLLQPLRARPGPAMGQPEPRPVRPLLRLPQFPRAPGAHSPAGHLHGASRPGARPACVAVCGAAEGGGVHGEPDAVAAAAAVQGPAGHCGAAAVAADAVWRRWVGAAMCYHIVNGDVVLCGLRRLIEAMPRAACQHVVPVTVSLMSFA